MHGIAFHRMAHHNQLTDSLHPSDDCSHYSNFPSLFPVPHYARHKMSGVSM